MGDSDIFVKRVEVNNNNQPVPINPVIVNGSPPNSDEGKLPENPTFIQKIFFYSKKFGITDALAHIGLLVALGLFCYGGGYVIKHLNYPLKDPNLTIVKKNFLFIPQFFITPSNLFPERNFSGFYHIA